jgi:hypothetical protein
MDRTFGVIAAIGLGLAVFVHALTFYPGPSIVTQEGAPVWLLHIGMFVPFTAMVLSMARQLGSRRGWADQMSLFPRWARVVIFAAGIYMSYNFIRAPVSGGTAEIRNGQFVLASHGSVSTLSEDQYLAFKRDEVRGPSGHWIFFFIVPTLYFLFGRRPQANPSGDAL